MKGNFKHHAILWPERSVWCIIPGFSRQGCNVWLLCWDPKRIISWCKTINATVKFMLKINRKHSSLFYSQHCHPCRAQSQNATLVKPSNMSFATSLQDDNFSHVLVLKKQFVLLHGLFWHWGSELQLMVLYKNRSQCACFKSKKFLTDSCYFFMYVSCTFLDSHKATYIYMSKLFMVWILSSPFYWHLGLL